VEAQESQSEPAKGRLARVQAFEDRLRESLALTQRRWAASVTRLWGKYGFGEDEAYWALLIVLMALGGRLLLSRMLYCLNSGWSCWES
jgi:hypothetical protein